MAMNLKEYYIQHSDVTDPGEHFFLFDALGTDIPDLCHIIQNLIFHYSDEEVFNYKIPLERFKEMDVRFVKDAIDLILSYDRSPLNVKRKANKRIIGVCRDNSAMLCSILRSKKIPARLRTGFINYIVPGIYLDVVYVEYWNNEKQAWCVVDTRNSPVFMKKAKIDVDFNLYDLPEEKFISAAKAWQHCRTERINPNRFGSKMHRGLWYVRNRLLQDFALLNKYEVLIWDLWGMMLSTDEADIFKVRDDQMKILDDLSEFVINKSFDINEIHKYYSDNEILHMPKVMLVDNPFAGTSNIRVSN